MSDNNKDNAEIKESFNNKKGKIIIKNGKKYRINEYGQEEEDWTESEYDKPLNIPTQEVEISTKMDDMDKIEKNCFKSKDKIKFNCSLRCINRYRNPINQNNPILKDNKNPEIYTVSLSDDYYSYATGYSNGEIHMKEKENKEYVVQYSRETIVSVKHNPKYNYVLISANAIGEIVHTHISSGKKLSEFKIDENSTDNNVSEAIKKNVSKSKTDRAVRAMDVSNKGEKFAIGFSNGEIYLYNESTQTLDSKIGSGTSFYTGHINQIHSVVFDRQNINNLVSGGRDRRVILWDLRTCQSSMMITEPFIVGDTIDIKNNYIIAGSYETSQGILAYDIRKFDKAIKSFKTFSQLYCCKFSKKENDMKFAAGGYKINCIKVFNFDGGENYICGIEGNGSPCYALDFNYHGTVLGYGCSDGGIRLVDFNLN